MKPTLIVLAAAISPGLAGCPSSKTVVESSDSTASVPVADSDGSGVALAPHLESRPQLFARDGGRIVEAPAADHELARRYPRFADKGAITSGLRVTILADKQRVVVGEAVRVVHVVEAPEAGRELYVMGPKPAHDEMVDGVRRTAPTPVGDYPWVGVYDGRVIPSPAVDYNYEVTQYRFDKPGRHRIQWKPGALASNVLTIEVGPR